MQSHLKLQYQSVFTKQGINSKYKTAIQNPAILLINNKDLLNTGFVTFI